jgi:HSP20 family protein
MSATYRKEKMMWTNRILDEMDRLFGPTLSARPNAAAPAPYPALNLREDNDNLYVEAELPGMTQDQIEITVAEGDQLTVAGQREAAASEGCIWHRQESGYGRFTRTVTLPVVVDATKVEAVCESGVLTLTLPKSETAKPRRIAVKSLDSPQSLAHAS